jgi:hypothetical protein
MPRPGVVPKLHPREFAGSHPASRTADVVKP